MDDNLNKTLKERTKMCYKWYQMLSLNLWSFLFSPNLMRKLRKLRKMRKTKCWEL